MQMRSAYPWIKLRWATPVDIPHIDLLSTLFLLLVPSSIDPDDLQLDILTPVTEERVSSADPMHLHIYGFSLPLRRTFFTSLTPLLIWCIFFAGTFTCGLA